MKNRDIVNRTNKWTTSQKCGTSVASDSTGELQTRSNGEKTHQGHIANQINRSLCYAHYVLKGEKNAWHRFTVAGCRVLHCGTYTSVPIVMKIILCVFFSFACKMVTSHSLSAEKSSAHKNDTEARQQQQQKKQCQKRKHHQHKS